MKQIIDTVDWAFYTLLFLALGLWILFVIFASVELTAIEDILTTKMATELTIEKGTAEDLINDFKAQRDGKL